MDDRALRKVDPTASSPILLIIGISFCTHWCRTWLASCFIDCSILARRDEHFEISRRSPSAATLVNRNHSAFCDVDAIPSSLEVVCNARLILTRHRASSTIRVVSTVILMKCCMVSLNRNTSPSCNPTTLAFPMQLSYLSPRERGIRNSTYRHLCD